MNRVIEYLKKKTGIDFTLQSDSVNSYYLAYEMPVTNTNASINMYLYETTKCKHELKAFRFFVKNNDDILDTLFKEYGGKTYLFARFHVYIPKDILELEILLCTLDNENG